MPDAQPPLIFNPVEEAQKIFDECMSLMKAKNNDYAGPQEFFKNLAQCEQLGICSVEQGILVRLSDKASRLATLLGSGKVEAKVAESIEDTLRDQINYSMLLLLYLRSRQYADQHTKAK